MAFGGPDAARFNDERNSNYSVRYQPVPRRAILVCVRSWQSRGLDTGSGGRAPTDIEFTTDAQSAASITSAMPRSWLPGLALCVETYGPKLRLLTVTCFGLKTRRAEC